MTYPDGFRDGIDWQRESLQRDAASASAHARTRFADWISGRYDTAQRVAAEQERARWWYAIARDAHHGSDGSYG